MSFIAPLFLALSEFLTSGRSAKAVAEENGLSGPELDKAIPRARAHSWQGKLAAALANSSERHELIPLLIHLARLERHHAELVAQHERAQKLTDEIRTEETINLDKYMKAEAFSFKVHTALGRVLRDIQRAEIRLEKAQKPAPAHTSTSNSASGGRKSPEWLQTSNSVGAVSHEPTTNHRSPVTNNDSQILPPDPLLHAVLVRHRQRIKNAPPKDRQALIARLIEEERTRASRQVA